MGKLQELSKGPTRRAFLAGTGALGAAALAGCSNGGQVQLPTQTVSAPSPSDVLNFALNLEYLEAEFYLRATTGAGLSSSMTGNSTSTITAPTTTMVPFAIPAIRQFAVQTALDEFRHVQNVRAAITSLGSTPINEPAIDFTDAFNALAVAAGLITSGQTFNPFADDYSFLLGGFVFNDVGVTAYTGAAPYLLGSPVLSAAAGIQAVEAYHASAFRAHLAQAVGTNQLVPGTSVTFAAAAAAIGNTRATLSGTPEAILANGYTSTSGAANGSVSASTIVNADANGLTYGRSPSQVMHIVYGAAGGAGVSKGGFFPSGLNGNLTVTTA